jgi:glucoamylase
VTFNLGNGILNEVYFPHEDIACICECGLVITDGKEFLSLEKKDARHKIRMIEPGIPLYQVQTHQYSAQSEDLYPRSGT